MNKLFGAKMSQIWLFLGGPVPPLYVSFPDMRLSVSASVHHRKPVEAEFTMTMKIKVINIDENIPKIHFGYSWDPSRTW